MSDAVVEDRRIDLYDEVFRNHYPLLRRIVRRAGIPTGSVDDVVSEIMIKMLESSGLEKFDWDQPHKLQAYLWSYVALSSRAWLTRILTARQRHAPLEEASNYETAYRQSPIEEQRFIRQLLAEVTDADARVFITLAFETFSYHDARAQLLERGWDKARVSLAVRRARAGTRRLLCTK